MDFVKQIPENDQHKLGMLLNLFHDGQKKIYTTIEKKCCSNAKKNIEKVATKLLMLTDQSFKTKLKRLRNIFKSFSDPFKNASQIYLCVPVIMKKQPAFKYNDGEKHEDSTLNYKNNCREKYPV